MTYPALLLATALLGPLTQAHAAPSGRADFTDTHYTGSAQCAQCHDGLSDANGRDVSLRQAWASSMMANAARDPYWRAKVAAELHRNPHLSDEINDKCSRCHAPMANDAAKKDGSPLKILGDNSFTDPNGDYFDAAMDGVSCSLCHQIADDGNLGTLAGSSGRYRVLTYPNRADRPAYGQYPDPFTRPMQQRVAFTPQLGTHTQSAEFCGVCHDLKTPFVDAQGDLASTTPESEFPEQSVYSEWAHSDYRTGGPREQRCQSCHMPVADSAVTLATRPHNLSPREGFSQHNFLGANTVMLQLLDDHRSALGVSATGFDRAIEANRSFLKTAAELSLSEPRLENGILDIQLTITNHAGHKLPSGYPSRRVYVHFKVEDENGVTLFESGRLQPDGSIKGVDLDTDPTTFEPHYDLITAADQVQVYEPIMRDTDGNVTHTLLRAAAYVKDNRLLPAGFDKASAPPDVRVAGAAQQDENFIAGGDQLTYRVKVGDRTRLRILAELRYQPLSFGHLRDLFTDTALPEVAIFKRQFEDASLRDEVIASASRTLGDLPERPAEGGGGLTDGANTGGGGSSNLLWSLALLLIHRLRGRHVAHHRA